MQPQIRPKPLRRIVNDPPAQSISDNQPQTPCVQAIRAYATVMTILHPLPRESTWLIPEIADPFVMFPLQSVARELSGLLADSDRDLIAAPPARKYWDVTHEHAHEKCGLLLGAAFVLAQAALTQTASITYRLKYLLPDLPLPEGRDAMLALDAPADPETSMSVLVVVDTAANYFKHYHQWPPDWSFAEARPPQRRTIQNALKIGMEPRPTTVTDNLIRALRRSGASGLDVERLTHIIQSWREQLVVRLSRLLDIPNPNDL